MKTVLRRIFNSPLAWALVLSLAIILPSLPGLAAVTATPVFVQTPKIGKVQFLQGTDTAGTYKTVMTGGSNGSKIVGMYVTTNDASATHLMTIEVSSSTSAHCSPSTSCFGGVSFTLAVSSGFANAAPAVNAMSPSIWPGLPRDSDGNPFLYLPDATYTIEATFATALTAAKWINIVVVYADF